MAKEKAQISLDDRIIKNPELEAKLEERQGLKESAAAYRKADKEAKVLAEALNEPTPFRVGRFIIDKTTRPPKTVSFETDGSSSITIKTADEG